jgi:hypothetical protein
VSSRPASGAQGDGECPNQQSEARRIGAESRTILFSPYGGDVVPEFVRAAVGRRVVIPARRAVAYAASAWSYRSITARIV